MRLPQHCGDRRCPVDSSVLKRAVGDEVYAAVLCLLQGVMRARGSHILFADADAATEITDLDRLCAAACCQTTYDTPHSRAPMEWCTPT